MRHKTKTQVARKRPSTARPRSVANDLQDDEIQMVCATPPRRPAIAFPGFRPGNILRVTMKNFLTFTEAVICPGPRMNLIIGPNGAGKSTVVSAVCVVFNGATRILGRSTDLGSFVKYGTNRATVEADVYDPEAPNGVRCVRREFDSDGKGQFYLDGDKVSGTQLAEKVTRKYDIQLDNLSQFMPQEKIAEFTNLESEDLLLITVRSLGGTDKENELKHLQQQDQTVAGHEDEVKNKEQTLATLVTQQESEAAEVQAFREQQQVKKRLAILKRFLPTVQAEELKHTYVTLRLEHSSLDESLSALEEEMRRVSTGPINACKQQCEAATEAWRVARENSKSKEQQTTQLINASDDISMKLSQRHKELVDVQDGARRRERAIQQAQAKLAEAEERYRNDVSPTLEAELSDKLAALEDTRSKIRTDIRAQQAMKDPLEQQRHSASRAIKYNNHRLQNLNDVRKQRMEMLCRFQRNRRVADCDALVSRMTDQKQFRGQVFGPVAAEIEVDCEYHGRIMESAVSGFLLTCFVTESAADSRTLMNACRRELQGWAPNLITAPTTRDDEPDTYAIQAQVPGRPVDDRLRRLGIECMVSEIYRAPGPVRAALNAQAMLHNIHVGSGESEGWSEELRYEDGISAWYTPKARCNVVRSRYDGSVRNLRMDTQFANVRGEMYSGSFDQAARETDHLKNLIREEEEKLHVANKKMKDVEMRLQELNGAMRDCTMKINEVVAERTRQSNLKENVKRMKANLNDIRRRAEAKDTEQEKAGLEQRIANLEGKVMRNVSKMTESLKGLRDSLSRLDELLVARVEAERQLEAEKAKHASVEEQLNEAAAKRDDAKRRAKDAKIEWKAKLDEAKRALSEAQRKAHEAILAEYEGRSVDEVESEIAELTGRMAGLATGGQAFVEQYEHRQRKIDKLERDLAHVKNEQEARMKELREQKDAFLEWLKLGIDKMRTKFSALYRRLGCAGDLELINMESNRMSELALQVLVSYRKDEELRPISSASNSGGEKMCCTMLFCFSLLQDEERMPPFVMVDELNQGLDHENEYKIMSMMFEDAELDSAPQSFVISPKLLSNLPFHSHTKTHMIFNGNVTGKVDILEPATRN